MSSPITRGFASRWNAAEVPRAILDAASLIRREPERGEGEAEGVGFRFRSNVGGSEFDMRLQFETVPGLPGRSNIVIGYNGTGKTQLLANLAMVGNADLDQQASAQFREKHGHLSESAPRFGAVIAVSYSAFDTFEVPGTTVEEEQLEQSGDVFGYVYCGLRSLDQPRSTVTQRGGQGSNRLKSIDEVTDELRASLTGIPPKGSSVAANASHGAASQRAILPARRVRSRRPLHFERAARGIPAQRI